MTVPFVVIVALVLGGLGSGGGNGSATPSGPAPLPPVTVSAPPSTSAPTISTCAQVISALPLRLDGHDLRRTVSNPPSSSIVAWGEPPIVLRCGVARPAELTPSLTEQLFAVNGVLFLPHRSSDVTRWTVVDRAVFVDVSVPTSYAQPPLGPIASAVAKVLPTPVCVQDPTAPRARLCTRRR